MVKSASGVEMLARPGRPAAHDSGCSPSGLRHRSPVPGHPVHSGTAQTPIITVNYGKLRLVTPILRRPRCSVFEKRTDFGPILDRFCTSAELGLGPIQSRSVSSSTKQPLLCQFVTSPRPSGIASQDCDAPAPQADRRNVTARIVSPSEQRSATIGERCRHV